MMDRTETMNTSVTGGMKASKMAQLGAVDPIALLAVAEVAGFGAEKYEYHNFLKGYDYSLSFDAMMRHLLLFWAGEDIDPESGQPHLAHAAWHALALMAFQIHGVGTDNRPIKKPVRVTPTFLTINPLEADTAGFYRDEGGVYWKYSAEKCGWIWFSSGLGEWMPTPYENPSARGTPVDEDELITEVSEEEMSAHVSRYYVHA